MGHPAARERGRNLRELLRKLKPRLVCPSSWLGKMAREALPWCECSVVPNGVEDPVMMSEQMNEVLPGPVSRDNEYAGGSFALSASAEGGLGMLKSSARKSLGIVRSAKVMLFAAHGGEKCLSKGGDKWMRIWESVKAAVSEAVGIMAGGERFERRGDLLFWPYAGRDAMNRVMLCADMFVHVSPAENHPLVLLEAFAAGVPACAFAVGGVPEQIVNGECGSLHPCGDYAGLIRSVVNALKRPPLLRKWSFAARERYERHFTVERMCAEYLKIYENLLNGQV